MGCDLQFAKHSVVCNLEAVGSADTNLWLVSASPAFFFPTGVCICCVLMMPLWRASAITFLWAWCHSISPLTLPLCAQQSARSWHLPDLIFPHSLALDAKSIFSSYKAINDPETHLLLWLETGR